MEGRRVQIQSLFLQGVQMTLIHTILDVRVEVALLITEIWMLVHLFSKLMVRDG